MSYLTIGDSQLYYEVSGAGKPILFLHDGMLDSTCWDHQFSTFAKRYQVIRYDRQGYGRSGVPTSPFSMLETIQALLAHLQIAEVSLIGGSMGGALALQFTIAHPHLVSKLVIVGSHLIGMPFSAAFEQRMQTVFLPMLEEGDFDAKIDRIAQDPYLLAPENQAVRVVLRQKLLANPRCQLGIGQIMRQDLIRFADFLAVDRLQEVRTPTLIILGAADAPDIYNHTAAMQAGIRQARREIIANAGHLVYWEKPEEFDQLVLSFLQN
ncbi:MAG: alpha/beta hydrolase [Caldilinea sp. CFX5]|nr:alpha/beta hydrolase [Caldilinea sp. CFX5]